MSETGRTCGFWRGFWQRNKVSLAIGVPLAFILGIQIGIANQPGQSKSLVLYIEIFKIIFIAGVLIWLNRCIWRGSVQDYDKGFKRTAYIARGTLILISALIVWYRCTILAAMIRALH